MKEIPIRHRNGTISFFTVSDEDYEFVKQWKWSAVAAGYIYRWTRNCENCKPRTMIHLHRAIMERAGYNLAGLVVDHIDGNPLNNARENLRPCTTAQNIAAGRTRSNKTSLYRGVSWQTSTKKWRVVIRVSGKQQYLGTFDSEDDAARAYNAAALQYWGEFAVLNDVPAIQLELPFAA